MTKFEKSRHDPELIMSEIMVLIEKYKDDSEALEGILSAIRTAVVQLRLDRGDSGAEIERRIMEKSPNWQIYVNRTILGILNRYSDGQIFTGKDVANDLGFSHRFFGTLNTMQERGWVECCGKRRPSSGGAGNSRGAGRSTRTFRVTDKGRKVLYFFIENGLI